MGGWVGMLLGWQNWCTQVEPALNLLGVGSKNVLDMYCDGS